MGRRPPGARACPGERQRLGGIAAGCRHLAGGSRRGAPPDRAGQPARRVTIRRSPQLAGERAKAGAGLVRAAAPGAAAKKADGAGTDRARRSGCPNLPAEPRRPVEGLAAAPSSGLYQRTIAHARPGSDPAGDHHPARIWRRHAADVVSDAAARGARASSTGSGGDAPDPGGDIAFHPGAHARQAAGAGHQLPPAAGARRRVRGILQLYRLSPGIPAWRGCAGVCRRRHPRLLDPAARESRPGQAAPLPVLVSRGGGLPGAGAAAGAADGPVAGRAPRNKTPAFASQHPGLHRPDRTGHPPGAAAHRHRSKGRRRRRAPACRSQVGLGRHAPHRRRGDLVLSPELARPGFVAAGAVAHRGGLGDIQATDPGLARLAPRARRRSAGLHPRAGCGTAPHRRLCRGSRRRASVHHRLPVPAGERGGQPAAAGVAAPRPANRLACGNPSPPDTLGRAAGPPVPRRRRAERGRLALWPVSRAGRTGSVPAAAGRRHADPGQAGCRKREPGQIMPRIQARDFSPQIHAELTRQGQHPVLARVYAARGITQAAQLDDGLARLIPPSQLKNVQAMARILADAIEQQKRLLVIADYDADGATACAVALRALRAFGAQADYLVPTRFEYGYGLTPEIVQLAAAANPDILITVDNGITSCDGVAEANRLGMTVLVTDHHLPAETLPDAACIVNPNQPGCNFPSKHLAGVGVIYYVMLALRAELRNRGAFTGTAEPNLAQLLDLVALGTVADVVRLDDNNRILVRQGLLRIRSGHACAGINALLQGAGREPGKAGAYDLGCVVGPRLNAAGRLTDMALGIECLLTDDAAEALALAQQLDALNRERREIEAGMQDSALAALERIDAQDSFSLCLYRPDWHQGVIGILASRLKDRLHRPVIAFAPGQAGELKGSGRSIPALHLRDTLDLLAKRHPRLLQKFGGHAFAAGVTIRESDLAQFSAAFEAIARSLLTPAELERVIETDGMLQWDEMTLELARLLEDPVWGQGFPQPQFYGEFTVEDQRIVC